MDIGKYENLQNDHNSLSREASKLNSLSNLDPRYLSHDLMEYQRIKKYQMPLIPVQADENYTVLASSIGWRLPKRHPSSLLLLYIHHNYPFPKTHYQIREKHEVG